MATQKTPPKLSKAQKMSRASLTATLRQRPTELRPKGNSRNTQKTPKDVAKAQFMSRASQGVSAKQGRANADPRMPRYSKK